MASRKITTSEIDILKQQGCTAQDWKSISVDDAFPTENIRNVDFFGTIKIGDLAGEKKLPGGIEKGCGIVNSQIANCTIGDHCLISNVRNLANYDIGDNVIIENCKSIISEGNSGFGNGVELDVLNEGGGRTLPIFDILSSQIAYLLVNYRHDKLFTEKLLSIIADYSNSKKTDRGIIGSGSVIRNSGIIKNVSFGECSNIDNITHLEEGTVASTKDAAVHIGDNVIAKEFIIQSGSKVDASALIDRCFIGQGVKIGKQYSAENSVFFANSEGFHGEACSVFGGPYTVTHHKSTLLIAGLFSFYNAGSGTNQSNHMYKLGPIHQGVLERGSKTGSFSYMLWPSRVGAFSVVTGKHTSNFDGSDFPFSYITEENGKPQLTPAMNLFTVGTRRDSVKWPARDRRKDTKKYDLLHFDLFNPYTVGKMDKGLALLRSLSENTPKEQEYVNHKGCHIKRLMLKTCSKYYDMAIKVYIGNELIKRLDKPESIAEIKTRLFSVIPKSDDWKDLSGMLVSESALNKMIDRVNSGKVKSVHDLNQALQNMFDSYTVESWKWVCHLIEKRYEIKVSEITREHFLKIVSDWESASVKFNNMIQKDASKEFDQNSRIAYGIDS
ncbi:MAG: DUF4954 family protein, partial [Candidatus Marinimicrobia bacterium]|nr:DUF4954 family protein [Candidatus Neomarinimicrobiota bacterium]